MKYIYFQTVNSLILQVFNRSPTYQSVKQKKAVKEIVKTKYDEITGAKKKWCTVLLHVNKILIKLDKMLKTKNGKDECILFLNEPSLSFAEFIKPPPPVWRVVQRKSKQKKRVTFAKTVLVQHLPVNYNEFDDILDNSNDSIEDTDDGEMNYIRSTQHYRRGDHKRTISTQTDLDKLRDNQIFPVETRNDMVLAAKISKLHGRALVRASLGCCNHLAKTRFTTEKRGETDIRYKLPVANTVDAWIRDAALAVEIKCAIEIWHSSCDDIVMLHLDGTSKNNLDGEIFCFIVTINGVKVYKLRQFPLACDTKENVARFIVHHLTRFVFVFFLLSY